MNVIRTLAELRAALLGPRRAGETIGLVPTMGAFHEGHLSLMRRARRDCDVVVVSLFVNPAQFNDPGDLERYPRDRERDEALAAEIGVDYLFAPSVEEVYPAGFATTVSVDGLTETLEGAYRGRGHFDGVTTVVSKLFNMVGAGRGVLRAEGRPAGARHPPARARPRHPGPDRGVPDRPRARRAGPVEPERPPVRRATALAPPRFTERSPPFRRRSAPASATPRPLRTRALDELSAAGIEPDYVELVSRRRRSAP